MKRNLRVEKAGKPKPQSCGEGTVLFFARRRGRDGIDPESESTPC